MTPSAWLFARFPGPQAQVLAAERDRVLAADLTTAAGRRVLCMTYAQVSRHFPRQPLGLRPPGALRPGWDPSAWTLDQAARAWLLASLDVADDTYIRALDDCVARADIHELVALYAALPILPHQPRLVDRAAEGLRSNMVVVFTAVALDNPYPHEHLDETRWNQLVLKAFFLGLPTHRILGLDARANPDLTRMLTQYAHERWAAARPVPLGLWRCVAAFADDAALADLARVLASADPREQEAARLALAVCPHPRALALRDRPAQLDWADLEA